MRLSEVQHQGRAQSFVAKSLQRGRLPHGLIFAGPEGVGKRMYAFRLGRVLLCDKPDLEGEFPTPCEKCVNCELSLQGNHPDFNVVDRTLAKFHPDSAVRRRAQTQLGVEIVRHFLIGPANMRPGTAKAKVFLLTEADLLNASSQNALLKTLEEPPNDCYIILLVSSAQSLLETTLSRCQVIEFDALPDAFVTDVIRSKSDLNDAAVNLLTVAAQGSAGRAEWLATIEAYDVFSDVVGALIQSARDSIGAGQSLAALAKTISEKIKSNDEDLPPDTNETRLGQTTVLELASIAASDCLRLASGLSTREIGLSHHLTDYVATTPPNGWSDAIKAVNLATYQVSRSFNAGLIFDAVGIAIGRAMNPNVAAA